MFKSKTVHIDSTALDFKKEILKFRLIFFNSQLFHKFLTYLDKIMLYQELQSTEGVLINRIEIFQVIYKHYQKSMHYKNFINYQNIRFFHPDYQNKIMCHENK